MSSQGLLYVVWGEQHFFDEAGLSSSSVRRFGHKTCLVTDTPERCDPNAFDEVRKVEFDPALHLKRNRRIQMYDLSPFELTLSVDSDTLFLSDPNAIFGYIRDYDLCLLHADIPYIHIPGIGVLIQYSGAFIAFKKNCESVGRLFEQWATLATTTLAKRLMNQTSLAAAVAREKINPFILPNTWLLRPQDTVCGVTVSGPIYAWHTREEYTLDTEAINNWNQAFQEQYCRAVLKNRKLILTPSINSPLCVRDPLVGGP